MTALCPLHEVYVEEKRQRTDDVAAHLDNLRSGIPEKKEKKNWRCEGDLKEPVVALIDHGLEIKGNGQ